MDHGPGHRLGGGVPLSRWGFRSRDLFASLASLSATGLASRIPLALLYERHYDRPRGVYIPSVWFRALPGIEVFLGNAGTVYDAELYTQQGL